MADNKWVSMWGNAVSIATHRPESYAKNITLRYPIYAPFSGSALKLTFDNYCGTEAITISGAAIAVSTADITGKIDLPCPIDAGKCADITFHGKESVTIPAGERIVSDAIDFEVTAGSTLCVSIYFSDFTLMQSAVLITGPLSKGYFSIGDQLHTESLPWNDTKDTNWFYFLSNIDILTDAGNRAIICYGDSITAQAWPDYLTLRLKEQGLSHTSIIRRAASGTRILRQYDCITYDSYGLKGTNRYQHEIPTDGADTVIIQQGINDIIHPVGTDINHFRPMSDLPTATELIDGLKWYIEETRKLGYKVYLGTLLPIYGWRTFAPFRDDLRCEVNAWMRSATEADGCIDFDLALRDRFNNAAFQDGFDSGDHLHPNNAAYKKMADTVPANILY